MSAGAGITRYLRLGAATPRTEHRCADLARFHWRHAVAPSALVFKSPAAHYGCVVGHSRVPVSSKAYWREEIAPGVGVRVRAAHPRGAARERGCREGQGRQGGGQALRVRRPPPAADGSVDEEAIPTADQIGELENIKPKKKVKSLTKTLEPADYVLFCNTVEEESDGTVEVHYAKGMHRGFTVG
jgi:hypothetical protein